MHGIESHEIVGLWVTGIAVLMVQAGVVKHLLSWKATERTRPRKARRWRR
jgi:hypothetical protein